MLSEAFHHALNDENPYVRIKAAVLLLRLRIDVDAADESLASDLKVSDSDIRLFAIGEISDSGCRRVSPKLRQSIFAATSDPDDLVRESAKALLNSIQK